MTEASFTIALDATARTMRIDAVGLWTVELVDDYERAIGRELSRYRRAGGQLGSLDVLIDLTLGGVEKTEVVERLKIATQRYVPMARRIALLVPDSAIKRLQVRRINDTPKQRIFATREEALAWLAEPDEQLKAAS